MERLFQCTLLGLQQVFSSKSDMIHLKRLASVQKEMSKQGKGGRVPMQPLDPKLSQFGDVLICCAAPQMILTEQELP